MGSLTAHSEYWDAVVDHMTTHYDMDVAEARRRVNAFVDALTTNRRIRNPDYVYHASPTSVGDDLARHSGRRAVIVTA